MLTALKAQTLTNPSLLLDESNKILYRHPASLASPSPKVALICGGGSGHEPAYVGYVGRGGLTACVAGTVFASPSAEQVRACVARRLPRDAPGILVIVMNYTGDVLNFGMGAEKARAMGRNVEMIVIGDDVGVGRAKGGKVGRRGIAGATMAVKICGALAEAGASLADTARVGRLAGDNVVAVATSLARVHVLGRDARDADEEAARLPPGTMELGMGIHNEPGCEQLATDLPGIVTKMLAQLLDPHDADRYYVQFAKGDPVVLQINNFGGVSNLELGAITTEVVAQLGRDWGVRPVRVYSGVFNGSLNGPGFGIALLRLADTGLGPGKGMLELLDAPCEIVGWPAPIKPETFEAHYPPPEDAAVADDESLPSNVQGAPASFSFLISALADSSHSRPGALHRRPHARPAPRHRRRAARHALRHHRRRRRLRHGPEARRRGHPRAPRQQAADHGPGAGPRGGGQRGREHHGRHLGRHLRHLPQRARGRAADRRQGARRRFRPRRRARGPEAVGRRAGRVAWRIWKGTRRPSRGTARSWTRCARSSRRCGARGMSGGRRRRAWRGRRAPRA